MPRKCWACDAELAGKFVFAVWLNEVVCHRCDEAYMRVLNKRDVVATIFLGTCMLATFACSLIAFAARLNDAPAVTVNAHTAAFFFSALAAFAYTTLTTRKDPATTVSCILCAAGAFNCLVHPVDLATYVDFLTQAAFWGRYGVVCAGGGPFRPSVAEEEESKARETHNIPRACWACDAELVGDVVCDRCREACTHLLRKTRLVAKLLLGVWTFVNLTHTTAAALAYTVDGPGSGHYISRAVSLYFTTTAASGYAILTSGEDPTALCGACAFAALACIAYPGYPTLLADFATQGAFWVRCGLTMVEIFEPSNANESKA